MKITTQDVLDAQRQADSDGEFHNLINLAAHRPASCDRFPDVEDLLDRLTDDTALVANGGYRA